MGRPPPSRHSPEPSTGRPTRGRPVLPALQALEKPKIWFLSEIFSFLDVGKYFIKKTCCVSHTQPVCRRDCRPLLSSLPLRGRGVAELEGPGRAGSTGAGRGGRAAAAELRLPPTSSSVSPPLCCPLELFGWLCAHRVPSEAGPEEVPRQGCGHGPRGSERHGYICLWNWL